MSATPTPPPSCRWAIAPKVVVWDVDDTLVLERDFARSGFSAVGEWLAVHHGLQGFFSAAWGAFERGVRGKIFNEALAALDAQGFGEEDIQRLVGVYREHPANIFMLGDAARVMDTLVEQGISMAVITDGPPEMQRNKVKALKLSKRCDPVVLGWEQGKAFGKPHPSSYESVERHYELKGADLVYIGDNPHKDFIAPRKMGWRTVRVRRPMGLHSGAPSRDDVDCELESLDDLLDILGVRTQ